MWNRWGSLSIRSYSVPLHSWDTVPARTNKDIFMADGWSRSKSSDDENMGLDNAYMQIPVVQLHIRVQ